MNIGIIGQGYVGKNLADFFEHNNYDIVRYSLEKEYVDNLKQISNCSIVFIAVPTPTINNVCDLSIVEEALILLKEGTTAVIKSTLIPNSVTKLQVKFPKIKIFYSPEFLRQKKAKYDTLHPKRNIIGIPINSDEYYELAKKIISILPKSKTEIITDSTSAELIKYISNFYFVMKSVYMNIFYDFSKLHDGNWNDILDGITSDPRIGKSHTKIFSDKGRGAGGNCLIKDSEALISYLKETMDSNHLLLLESIKNLNLDFLYNSKKDLDILSKIYGKKENYK